MKKVIIGIIVVIAIAAIVTTIVILSKNKENDSDIQTGVKIETAEEMLETLNSINTKLENSLPSLETREVDITDELTLSAVTGLKSNSNVEAVVVSEPLMSSQAYSAVMIKVSKDSDIEEMKQEIFNNIDTRKWICVSAEKLWVTNYEDVIFLIMSSEEWARPVYDEFKEVVGGKIGETLEKTEEI